MKKIISTFIILAIIANVVFAQLSANLSTVNFNLVSHDTAVLDFFVFGGDSIYNYGECRVGSGSYQPYTDTVLVTGATSSPQAGQLTLRGLPDNATLECRVKVFTVDTNGTAIANAVSNTRSFTTLLAPQVPVGTLTAQPYPTSISVRLDYVCGNVSTRYIISRALTNGGTPVEYDTLFLMGQGDTAVLFSSLTPHTPYYFEVNSFNTEGLGMPNNISVTTAQAATSTGLFVGTGSSTKTTMSGQYSLQPGTLVNAEGFVILDSMGIHIDTTALETTANVDTFSFNFSGLTPGKNYSVKLYAGDQNASNMIFQESVNISTQSLLSIVVISDSVAILSPTTVTAYVTVATDNVNGFPTTLSWTVMENGSVVQSGMYPTGLYGVQQVTIPLSGLTAGHTYGISYVANHINDTEYASSATFTMPQTVPPSLILGSWSNPTVNSVKVPVSLDDGGNGTGMMSLTADVYDLTNNQTLGNTITVLSNVINGTYDVTVGDYDPALDLRIIFTLQVNGISGNNVSETLYAFTGNASVPTVNCVAMNVDTISGNIRATYSPKGWNATGSYTFYEFGGSPIYETFTIGRNDTVIDFVAGMFSPNTTVFVDLSIETSQYGSIKKNFSFTTASAPTTPTGINDVALQEAIIINSGLGIVDVGKNEGLSLAIYNLVGDQTYFQRLEAGKNFFEKPTQAGLYILMIQDSAQRNILSRKVLF